jgi:hypothetical protein
MQPEIKTSCMFWTSSDRYPIMNVDVSVPPCNTPPISIHFIKPPFRVILLVFFFFSFVALFEVSELFNEASAMT